MFYLCDKERMESVKRLINLIIYSKHTDKVQKDELKKDLKKISSIRCQNNIEPLYSIAIKKKKEEDARKTQEKMERRLALGIAKNRESENMMLRDNHKSNNFLYNSYSQQDDEMLVKNSKYLQGVNKTEDNYSKYEAIDYEYNAAEKILTLYQIFEDLNLLNRDNIGRIFKIESEGNYGKSRVPSGPQTYLYIYINRDLKLQNLNKLHLNINASDEGEKIITWKPKIYKSEDRFNIENINTVDFKTAIYEEIEEEEIEEEEIEEEIEEEEIEEEIEEEEIDDDSPNLRETSINGSSKGGYAKSSKFKTKEVLGKLRRIYKIPNSKKEHIKHKGNLITVSEYKALMKLKKKYK
jgi:hypothetical protein